MGLEKRTVKIIVIVVVTVLVLGGILGLVLGLLLNQRYVELEVWPRSDDSYNWYQPVIQFRPHDPGSWSPWVNRINDFLKEYETTIPESPPRAPCSARRMDQRLPSPHCEQVMRMWAPCTADQFYGYPEGQPCVFLRLSYLHYWVPEPYNMSMSMSMSIPSDMPEIIKHHMRERPAQNFGDYVWVTCEGENPADQELIGPIQYIPVGAPPGFPLSRLHTGDRIPRSQRNQPDQVPPPLVAVFFERPRPDVVISVECRIWTRDIYYDRSSRVGRARFEIYVDSHHINSY